MAPTIKALDILAQQEPDLSKVNELVGDIFKTLASSVVKSNEARMEKIKKDLLPGFKSLCSNTPSTECLFGDNITRPD